MSLHAFIERVRAYGIRPENRRKVTAQQMYPWAVERQFQQDLQQQFVKAGTFYEQQALKNTWSFDENAWQSWFRQHMGSFHDNMDDLTRSEYRNDTELQPIAKRVAYEVETFQQRCFENFTETVIGARYIPPVVAPTLTDTWEKNFMTLCQSTNDEMKKKISAIVSDAVMNGNNIADTRKQIQNAVSTFSKSKASLIARTETAKLNMAISKAQMEEAGVEYYEWACMLDERTRRTHAAMDGKICIWSDPTKVYDLKTHKVKDRNKTAVHLHPGDDYNCRCIALPWDPLIEEELNQKKGKPNKQWLELKEQEKQKREEKKLERARLQNVPLFASKIYENASRTFSFSDFIFANTKENFGATVEYKKILETDDSASLDTKIKAVLLDLKGPAKKNKWYNTEKGSLEFIVDKKIDEGTAAHTLGNHGIGFSPETAELLFRALKKIARNNKATLSLNEGDAILTLWHELNHLKDKKLISVADFPLDQRMFLEAANEFITRHTADDFLRQLNCLTYENSTIIHDEDMLSKSLYHPFVKKIEIFVDHFKLNPYNFAIILRNEIDKFDIHSRDIAIKNAFEFIANKKISNDLLNEIVDKIIDETYSLTDFINLINQ